MAGEDWRVVGENVGEFLFKKQLRPQGDLERHRQKVTRNFFDIFFVIFIFLTFFSLPVLADDALVLPAHAWRFYLIPAWTTVKANFDAAGKRQAIDSGAGRMAAFNLGYAIEYGITNWLTTGIQWSPGTTLSSSLDFPFGDPQRRDKAHLNDAFDARAGFKLQLLGSKVRDPKRATGLFQSTTMRLALGLGIKFPLTAVDWDREAANFFQGMPYLAQTSDKHLVAPMAGLHGDYVFIRDSKGEIFINLYAQYVPYLSKGRYNETSLVRHLNPALAAVEIDHGYDFLVEVEPRFDRWVIARTLRIGFYLPLRYKAAPDSELDGVSQHNNSYSFTCFPTLDFFWLLPKFPIELKIGYQYNLAGKNSSQAHTLAVILRVIVL
jgi:hypothetical protein